MHSEDLIRWIIKILINSSSKCEIYNVGSDEAITIKQLANLISKKFKKKISIKNKKISKDSIDYYVPSVSKIKKELNLINRFNIIKSLDQILNL